jgi:hypothetical protein
LLSLRGILVRIVNVARLVVVISRTMVLGCAIYDSNAVLVNCRKAKPTKLTGELAVPSESKPLPHSQSSPLGRLRAELIRQAQQGRKLPLSGNTGCGGCRGRRVSR